MSKNSDTLNKLTVFLDAFEELHKNFESPDTEVTLDKLNGPYSDIISVLIEFVGRYYTFDHFKLHYLHGKM